MYQFISFADNLFSNNLNTKMVACFKHYIPLFTLQYKYTSVWILFCRLYISINSSKTIPYLLTCFSTVNQYSFCFQNHWKYGWHVDVIICILAFRCVLNWIWKIFFGIFVGFVVLVLLVLLVLLVMPKSVICFPRLITLVYKIFQWISKPIDGMKSLKHL